MRDAVGSVGSCREVGGRHGSTLRVDPHRNPHWRSHRGSHRGTSAGQAALTAAPRASVGTARGRCAIRHPWVALRIGDRCGTHPARATTGARSGRDPPRRRPRLARRPHPRARPTVPGPPHRPEAHRDGHGSWSGGPLALPGAVETAVPRLTLWPSPTGAPRTRPQRSWRGSPPSGLPRRRRARQPRPRCRAAAGGRRGPKRRRRAGAGPGCRHLGNRRRRGERAVRGGRSARSRRRAGRRRSRSAVPACARDHSSLGRVDRTTQTTSQWSSCAGCTASMPAGSIGWRRGSWVVGTSPRASVCRADAGAPQAAVVQVSTHGAVTVDELVAGVAALGPARRADRVGGPSLCGSAGERPWCAALTGAPDVGWRAIRPAPLPGRWTRPVVRQAGRAALQADEPQAPPCEPPPAQPAGPSLLPPLLSLGAGVVLAVVAQQPMLLILGGVGALGSLGTWAWHRVPACRGSTPPTSRAGRRPTAPRGGARCVARRDRSCAGGTVPRPRGRGRAVARGSSTLWSGRTSPGSALVVAVGDGPAGPLLVELAPGEALALVGPVGGHRGRRSRPGAASGRGSRAGRPRDRCHGRRS